MPTLKASPQGLKKIELAVTGLSGTNGWAKRDERWAEEASKWLPTISTSKGEMPSDVSVSTWSRFLSGYNVKAANFKAFCSVLKLNWEEVADLPVELQTDAIPPEKENLATTHISHISDSYQDWGDAPDLSATSFYGRHEEVSILEKWILSDRCRLIAILGIGGIGKTKLSIKLGKGGIGKSALSMKVAEQIQGEFEYVIWRSLLGEPSAQYVLDDVVKFLSNQQEANLPEIFSYKINRLLHYLRTSRCLIILDNAESVLQGSKRAGQYKDGFEDYGILFRKLGEVEHQSCVILTSREKSQEIALLEGKTRPVRSLHLGGLNDSEGRKIFEDNGTFSGTDKEWEELIKFYDGNPLALDIVAKHVRWAFEGSISDFLKIGKNIFGDLQDLLDWHFSRLSEAEKEIMYWFAISREPVSIELLREKFVALDSKEKVAESLQILGRRLPIEKSITGFTLQPVLIEYMTEQLIQQVCKEIKLAKSDALNSYSLIEAQAKDYVIESQKRVIIQPIINKIYQELGKNLLIQQLNKIILYTQNKNQKSGYTGGNVINLLNYLGVDLSDYDFSGIAVWQANLQGVNLQGVNFAHCNLSKSVFTQAFGGVSSVSYSPDDRFFAIGHTKNEISIWQVSNSQQITVCKGHSNWVETIVFSPDGETLASGSEDGSIKLWEVQSGVCLKTFSGHDNKVLSVAFSPDGETLASGSGDCTIKFWNLKDGNCFRTLKEHSGWVFSVKFTPDGEILASGSDDHTINLWKVDDGKLIKTLKGHNRGVKSISFSPDGRLLVSGGFDRTVRLWSIKDCQCIKVFQDHLSEVLSVAFSPDNQTFATSSGDQTIRIWDIEADNCIKTIQGHLSDIWSIAYSHDGQTILSGSEDQTVRIWQTQDGKCLKTIQGYTNALWSVDCHPNQQLVAVGCQDGAVQIWDSSINQFKKPLKGHTSTVRSIAFSPDGVFLASGSLDKTVKLWQVEKEECIRTLKGHSDIVISVAFSPNGKTLASAGTDHEIRLWNVETGEHVILEGNYAKIRTVMFSPDGQFLANGNELHSIKLWRVEDGKCVKTLEGHTGAIQAVAFSPDGQALASSSSDRTAILWDISSGQIISVLEGHKNNVDEICFSPDGELLATSSIDQTIRLWDAKTGQFIKLLQGHTNSVSSIAFRLDGQKNLFLISVSEDETIRFWNIQTGECIQVVSMPKPYEGVNITQVQGLTEVQIATLKALGAVEMSE